MPPITQSLWVPFKDVQAGDYLNTTYSPLVFPRKRGIHLVTQGAAPYCGDDRYFSLMRTDGIRVICPKDDKVTVWRPIWRLPTEQVYPLNRRQDRPLATLSDAHRAYYDGTIQTIFPIGSRWEYGPFVPDTDPWIVEVTGEAYTDGINYSTAPEDAEVSGKPCVYLPIKVLWPADSKLAAVPPHTLGALTPASAERVKPDLQTQYDRLLAEHETLKRTLDRQDATIDSLQTDLNEVRNQRAESEQRLMAAKVRVRRLSRTVEELQARISVAQRDLRGDAK